jgi:hypothetical protein
MKLRHLLFALAGACGVVAGCASVIGADFGEKSAPESDASTGGGNTGGTGGTPQCENDDDCKDACPESACKCLGNQCVSLDACETTAECKAKYGADPHACIESLCVPLLNQTDCKEVYPPTAWEMENAIFIGVMEDRSSPEWVADQIEYYIESVKLAQDQIENTIVGPGPATKQRNIALVICDEMFDSERASRHLIETVRVPVILGPSKPEHQNTVVEKVLGASSSIMLTRMAFTEVLASPKAYSLTPSATLRSLALESLMKEQEPDLRTRLGKTTTDPLKVALLTVNDIGYSKLNELIQDDVEVGGKKLNQLPGDQFITVTVHNLNGCVTAGDGGPLCEYADKTAELLAFRPNVVIVSGPEKLFSSVLKPLEQQWETTPCEVDGGPTTWSIADRPFYLSAFWDYTETKLQKQNKGCPPTDLPSEILFTQRTRSVDVYPQGEPADGGVSEGEARYIQFLADFKAKVNKPFAGQDAGMGLAYDSYFVVAYAIAAILATDSAKPFTGQDVANAFGSLASVGGVTAGTGVSDIKKVRDALNGGDSVNLQGIFSRILFDPVKRSPVYDYSVMCANANLANNLPGQASGQTFDTTNLGVLEGTFTCF